MKGNGLNLPEAVSINEQLLGDGFHGEERTIHTDTKVFLLERLVDVGFKKITVGNFGNPAQVPYSRNTDDLYRRVPPKPGVRYNALAANMRAVQRAIELKKEGTGPDIVTLPQSTSEAYCKWMFNKTSEEQWVFIEQAVKLAHDVGLRIQGGVSEIWSDDPGTKVSMKKAKGHFNRYLAIGVNGIQHVAGIARLASPGPTEVYEWFSWALDKQPDPKFHSFHLHDVVGSGLANILAAMQAGVTEFETCMGGLPSGSPPPFVDGVPIRDAFEAPVNRGTPPSSGMVSTEDFVVMCNSMGIETGVDLMKTLNIGLWVEKIIGRGPLSHCARLKL